MYQKDKGSSAKGSLTFPLFPNNTIFPLCKIRQTCRARRDVRRGKKWI